MALFRAASGYMISIHAPVKGATRGVVTVGEFLWRFQSTLP